MSLFDRLKAIFTGPRSLISGLAFAALFFVGGLAVSGAMASFTEYTNTMDFCISCHEMESTVYQEYKESVHYVTRVGARPRCADCHVPYRDWPRMIWHKIGATKELFFHMLGKLDTPEKFEAHRLELAQSVWTRMKDGDSEACRNCHKVEAWNLELQRPRARGQHESARQTGETCIDCHKGIAHKKIEVAEATEDEGFEDPFLTEENSDGDNPFLLEEDDEGNDETSN